MGIVGSPGRGLARTEAHLSAFFPPFISTWYSVLRGPHSWEGPWQSKCVSFMVLTVNWRPEAQNSSLHGFFSRM